MELTQEELNIDVASEMENVLYGACFPSAVRRRTYIFDGEGNCNNKEWVLVEVTGKEFCWYHVELPKVNLNFSQSEQFLKNVLSPAFRLDDIRSLVSNGPFFGHEDGALVFRVNSPGHGSSEFTFIIAARVTENSVITVSLEDDLEFLLTKNHSEEADNSVPKSVSNLVVHIVDSHVDHIKGIVTKLEIELNAVELEMDEELVCCCVSSPALDVVAVGCADGKIHVHNISYDDEVVMFLLEGPLLPYLSAPKPFHFRENFLGCEGVNGG
ncbi:hypothetical protein U1Q18_006288 [Sarracenia purpurea var. burkii]